jgi:hypothetical protein
MSYIITLSVIRRSAMAGGPKLRVKKYFGSSTIEEMILNLDEARGFLDYFWKPDRDNHTVVSVDGQAIKSFAELAAVASKDCYKNNAFVDVGLYLSNDGRKSIWPNKV